MSFLLKKSSTIKKGKYYDKVVGNMTRFNLNKICLHFRDFMNKISNGYAQCVYI